MRQSTTNVTPPTTRLKRLSARIDESLERVLKPAKGSPRVLEEAIRYCVFSSGKRFRPLLCLGGCEAVGGTIRRALSVACAIELIHTYSLVHDDLPAMDNADERRGRPSCHRRFGEATAILAGDALLTRAFEVLGSNGTPNTLAILRTLGAASGTAGLIGGQVLDLAPATARVRARASAVEEIARRKTAALITASVVSGGLAGGASAGALRRLRNYGQQLGLAFQLMDDLHDADGLVAVLGPARVRQRGLRLIERAQDALKPFGTRAWVLSTLAEWLAHASASDH